MEVAGSSINLTQLPEHVLSQILSYLSYSEIAECRRVCQSFNRVCWRMLNNAFSRVDRFHSQIQRNVKQQLPRRESERRNHQLSRHSDILSAVETRLSLLSMTYSKYIELDLCCFIPGKVLDELYRILRLLQQTDRQPPRAHEFLQELRDISSMAMEHFEEHVTPRLKPHIPPGTSPFYLPSIGGSPSTSDCGSPSGSVGSSPVQWPSTSSASVTPVRLPSVSVRQDLMRLQQQSRAQSTSLLALKKEQHEQRSKLSEHRRLITEQERKLQEQTRLISELMAHIQALEKNMELMAKHLTGFTGQQVVLRNTPQLPKIHLSAAVLSGGSDSLEKGDGRDHLPQEEAGRSGVNFDLPGPSHAMEETSSEPSAAKLEKREEGVQELPKQQKSGVVEIFDKMVSKPKVEQDKEGETVRTGTSLRNKGKSRKRTVARQEGETGREELSKRRRR